MAAEMNSAELLVSMKEEKEMSMSEFMALMKQMFASATIKQEASIEDLADVIVLRIDAVNQHSILADVTISESAFLVSDSDECEYFIFDQACPNEWNGNEPDEYDIEPDDNLDAESELVDTSARVDVLAMRCMGIDSYTKRDDCQLHWYYSSNLSSLSVIDTIANVARYYTAMMVKKLYLVAECLVYQPLREHIAAEASFLIVTVYAPTRILVC